MLYDPLAALAALGATARLQRDAEGRISISLTWSRASRHIDQRRGSVILARFMALLLLQLDVPPGSRPRTVQQLVAAGKIRIVDGRYIAAQK